MDNPGSCNTDSFLGNHPNKILIMENQDFKITDTLPFKKEEYVKDVEEYMKSPTEDLFYKLRKYRKQCIEYLKKHPDDFDMQVNLIDLNYLGISKSKPPVQKVQETKPQNMQDVIEDYWAEDDYYL